MSTPGNQELLEMIQVLEQRIVEQQETIVELRGKITMIENDLDDINGRTNKLFSNIVIKADWNEGIHIL